MTPDEFRARLPGVIAFPVTPFDADLQLDLPALRSNLSALLAHPFSAVVAAGGTGEVYALDFDEYAAVVETVIEETAGRCPVLAGAAFNPPLAVRMARHAADAGADGILAFPPYYPGADFEGLVGYYRAISEATALPLIIYSRDWAIFSPDQVERLFDEVPTLCAWKDGQADLRRYQMIMDRVGERLYWIGGAGDDMVPGYYALGIRTYTSSISNIDPALAIRLHELAAAGEEAELRKLVSRFVLPLYALRARGRGYEVSVMKRMMDRMGLGGGPVRPPLLDVRDRDLPELERLVAAWRTP